MIDFIKHYLPQENHFAFSELFPHCSKDEIYKALKSGKISFNLFYSFIFLNWLRQEIGKPIVINSGYRDITHNNSVGGVANSQHLIGLAFDLKRQNGLSYDILHLAHKHPKAFGQVIFYPTFIHVTPANTKYKSVSLIFHDKILEKHNSELYDKETT